MTENTSNESGMKVVFEDDTKTEYPIGVRLYKGGELAFISLASAVCLERLLKKAIKEAAKG